MKKKIFLQSLQIIFYSLFFILFQSCEPENYLISGEDVNQTDLKASQSDPAEKINDFYGPTQPMGNGVVRTVVSVDHNGDPVAVGLLFSEKALQNLPDEELNLTLELPNKAEGLIVNHVDFGYNPHGHEGPGFSVEHFDVHFYWISVEEKLSIPFSIGMENLPDPGIRPDGYLADVVTVPQMGRHWIEESQFSSTFDQTFIYGSYGDKFTFYEPMITMEYLKAKSFEESYEITPLGAYEEQGYYAGSYEISYDATKKQYRVMLTDLFWEEGS